MPRANLVSVLENGRPFQHHVRVFGFFIYFTLIKKNYMCVLSVLFCLLSLYDVFYV